jgi:ubiquinone/menaquinone biosynthesis C-methylase UbiE
MTDITEPTTGRPERDAAAGFRNVDRTGDAGHYVRFLEGASGVEQVRLLKRRSYELMQVQVGQQVLDVGCGLGDDVRALAALVGPSGRAVGVDASETMVAESRKRSEGLDSSVEFAVGDALRLDFPDNSFDACRIERTLQYVSDAARAVFELVRVTRPGGHVLALEPDHETTFVYPGDKATTRSILNAYTDGYPNGWIGRQLSALFIDAGLTDVSVLPEATFIRELELIRQMLLDAHLDKVRQTGLLPVNEVDAWLDQLVEARERGTFLFGATLFTVVGRKP